MEYVSLQGRFNFKEWIQSCQKVPLQTIEKAMLDIECKVVKALSYQWKVDTDELFISPALKEEVQDLLCDQGHEIIKSSVQVCAQRLPVVLHGQAKL